jgi:Cdc6-like AAA superfamily ATPase
MMNYRKLRLNTISALYLLCQPVMLSKRQRSDGTKTSSCAIDQKIIALAKTRLCKALNESTSCFHLREEEKRMRVLLDSVFMSKKSNSIIVIGDHDSGKELFVDEVLTSYTRRHSQNLEDFNQVSDTSSLVPHISTSNSSSNMNGNIYKSSQQHSEHINYDNTPAFRVARIRGMVDGDDSLALTSLARQLFIHRRNNGRKFDANLDYVEMALRSSYSAGVPTIIIVEDIHEFVRRKKQLLLYTLLDMMHQRDMLFALVGITHKADFNVSLEKRVVSRLNAQFVHLSPASAERICADLAMKLTLPSMAILQKETEKENQRREWKIQMGIDSSHRWEEDKEEKEPGHMQSQFQDEGMALMSKPRNNGVPDEEWDKFRKRFNDHILQLFPSPDLSLDSSNSSHSSGNGHIFIKASALRVIRGHVNHGRGITFFLRAAVSSVLYLSPMEPLLSVEVFSRALNALDPPCPSRTLRGCPVLEVILLAALVRLVGASRVGMAFSGVGNMVNPTSGTGVNRAIDGLGSDGSFTLSRVLDEFDKLTGYLKRDVIPRAALVQAATSLASMGFLTIYSDQRHGKRGMSSAASGATFGAAGEYKLRLLADLEELKMAFMLHNSGYGTGSNGASIGSSGREHSDTVGIAVGNCNTSARRSSLEPNLVISEHIRKAVLNPLEPVLAPHSGGLV